MNPKNKPLIQKAAAMQYYRQLIRQGWIVPADPNAGCGDENIIQHFAGEWDRLVFDNEVRNALTWEGIKACMHLHNKLRLAIMAGWLIVLGGAE